MSDTQMTGTVEGVHPAAVAEPPPIAMLFPLLQLAFAGLTLSFRLGIRLLVATVYPLRIVWDVIHALLSPVIIVLRVALDITLFTPFSIIRMIAVALYPVYVFCGVACIFGATVGVFGYYVSSTILNFLGRSKYFAPPPSSPSAVPPSIPQVTLRKRKRKFVRLQ